MSGDIRLMADSRLVKEMLDVPLKKAGFKEEPDSGYWNAGFKEKPGSWYWNNDEVVLLVNLQKSQYGDQYYLNGGIALKSLGAAAFPLERHCTIRFRLTAVVSEEERKEIESVFDLENESLPDTYRKEAISRLVADVMLPVIKGCLSESDIAETVKRGRLANAMIHKQVKDLVCQVC